MKDADLTIEPYPPRNIGGQHVGLGSTGVKVTHTPTNLQVMVNLERSQSKNKRVALSMIEWGLIEIGWKD